MLSLIALIISLGALFLVYSVLKDIERRLDYLEGTSIRLRDVSAGIVKYLKADLNNEPLSDANTEQDH